MHPRPENWVEIGRAVVYYARADQIFSAGIKCRHCMYVLTLMLLVTSYISLERYTDTIGQAIIPIS